MPDADGSLPGPRPAELTALLTDTVRAASEIALKTFRGPVKQWLKDRTSPVCEADIAVDRMLRERLAPFGSPYGWLSEETEPHPSRLAADGVWIVDPIDGTRAYLAGQSDWTISVALAIDGRPVVAALYAPVTDELFLAATGTGATRNGVPIATTAGRNLSGVRMAGPKRFGAWLATIDSEIVQTPRIGSLALRLARVAQGELDLTFAGGTSHDWDLAAADLLVHEAGGSMTGLTGQTVIYNRPDLAHGALLAAGRERHATLIDLMRNRLADLA